MCVEYTKPYIPKARPIDMVFICISRPISKVVCSKGSRPMLVQAGKASKSGSV